MVVYDEGSWITCQDAARELGVSATRVRQLVTMGQLVAQPAEPTRRRMFVSERSVEQLRVDRQPTLGWQGMPGPPRSTRPPAAFISYSHADKPLATRLALALTDLAIRPWIDDGELRIGDSLTERISEAIGNVDVVVAVVSMHSVRSPWCRKEISLAISSQLTRGEVVVLPLRVDGVDMPPSLADVVYLDLSERNVLEVARSIADVASRRHNE